MIEKPESIELFRMYLLGELPDDDQTRLEEVLFANEEYYEQLLVAEDELRYDYAEGLLDAARRARFEKRFTASPDDREKLELASALVSTLTMPAVEPPVAAEFGGSAHTPGDFRQKSSGKWDRLPSITKLATRSALEHAGVPDSWRQRLQSHDRLSRVTRLIPRLRVEKVEESAVMQPELGEQTVERPQAVESKIVPAAAVQPEAPGHSEAKHPEVERPEAEPREVVQSEPAQPVEVQSHSVLPTIAPANVQQSELVEREITEANVTGTQTIEPNVVERIGIEPSVGPKVVESEAGPGGVEPSVLEPKVIETPVETGVEPKLVELQVIAPAVIPPEQELLKRELAKVDQPDVEVPGAEAPTVGQAEIAQTNLEQEHVEKAKVEPAKAWELPEWELPQSLEPQAEQQEITLPEPEPLVASWRSISGWARLARLGLALVALVLIVSVAVIVVRTIQYQNQVRELRRELSLQNGFRAQTEEEKRKARELMLDLEVERNRRLMLEDEVAKHTKQTSQNVDPPPVAASFILSAGLNRDSGPLKKPLIQTGDAERVRLQLNLKRAGDYQTYQANLRTADGTLVWGQAGLRPSRFGPIQVIAVTLLARLVPPGDYHVELRGLAPGRMAEQVDDYYFSVAER